MSVLKNKDIISIHDLSLNEVEAIFKKAKTLQKNPASFPLKDKIVASCFFEPSTRTRLSFEAAALRLGGKVIGFQDDTNLSIKKGETLHDTIRVIDDYADVIIIRHFKEGAARLAADIAKHPVINAGDGANQHPTQALIDFFTIQSCQNDINGLSIALVGDLKYSRTIKSFIELCTLFNVRLYLVAPSELSLSDEDCHKLKKAMIRFSFHQHLKEVIPKVDILYMTRIQRERFEHKAQVNSFILTSELLQDAKPNLKILHPLPRVDEIEVSVDKTPYAYYFNQAANGVYIRQALLMLLMEKYG